MPPTIPTRHTRTHTHALNNNSFLDNTILLAAKLFNPIREKGKKRRGEEEKKEVKYYFSNLFKGESLPLCILPLFLFLSLLYPLFFFSFVFVTFHPSFVFFFFFFLKTSLLHRAKYCFKETVKRYLLGSSGGSGATVETRIRLAKSLIAGEKGRKFFSRCDASFKRSHHVITSTFRRESTAITMFRSFSGLLCKYERVGFTFPWKFRSMVHRPVFTEIKFREKIRFDRRVKH